MGKEIDLVTVKLDEALQKLEGSTTSSEQRKNQIQEAQALAMIAQTWVLLRILEKLDGKN